MMISKDRNQYTNDVIYRPYLFSLLTCSTCPLDNKYHSWEWKNNIHGGSSAIKYLSTTPLLIQQEKRR